MKRILALLAALALASPAWADSLGSVTGGTVATQSNLMGCYNGSQAPTSGQQAAVKCSSNGTISGPTTGSGAFTNATVGTTSASVLAANTVKVYLMFQNESTTATICINAGGAATITGSACGAAEITLPPLGGFVWEGTFVPTDQWFAIASGASTPLTIGVK